ACRHGDPELTLTVPAKLAVRMNHVAPATMARAIAIANRLLPGPAGRAGDRHRRGHQSETPLTESFATALTRRAAAANNEL
ncbi:MAG: ketoacyl reductase, partial [Acidobacteriota bacterium]|nr:ketoacyl reductase [Acidobacteriota bacterium]